MYFVYILRCTNNSFYVATVQSLEDRVKAHNDGRGAAYTFKHRPVPLVYSESFGSGSDALKRERQLKHWSHVKEEAVMNRDLEPLRHSANDGHRLTSSLVFRLNP